MVTSFPALALGILAALLLVAAWGDIRTRTIANGLNAAIAVMAPLWWWAGGLPFWPDAAWQIGLAAALFALFAGAFALGLMGGGDVKMIAALGLWFPALDIARLLVVMALVGGVLTLVVAIGHRARRRAGQPEIPYGVAIAAGGLWVIASHILTSFPH